MSSFLPLKWCDANLLEVAPVNARLVDPRKKEYREMFLIAPDHIESGSGRIINKVTAAQQEAISGKYLAKKNSVIYSKIRPYLMKAAITREDVLCSADMYPLECTGDLLPEYLLNILLSDRFTAYANSCSNRTGIPKINREELAQFALKLPPISEQTAIADLLSTWDAAIEKTERLIAAEEQRLDGLREKHLQKTTKSTQVKLKVVTRESTARNGVRLGRDSIMAVTKKVGMRPMKEETIAAGIERYKVVRPRAFAYNPMRLNIGSIVMSPFDADVLVSPDYVVFECDESRLLPGYLTHLRFSRHWTNYFESAGNGSVRVRIYYDDLSAFTFDLPPLDAQKRIVDFLDAVGFEIDLLKRQAEAYRRQKRGLMQKLLTGAWRVKVDTDQCGLTPTNTD